MAKNETVEKKEIKNSADARIKFLHERLGELTYQITVRTEYLNIELRAFQQKLSNDKELRDMQQESNKVATEIQKLKKK